MGNDIITRLRTAALRAMAAALWCWLLLAFYTIWKFGMVDGFLALGEIPFPSTMPINYLSFFMFTFGAFGITFAVGFVVCALAPRPWHPWLLCGAWLVGAAIAAIDVSFTFLDHGGGTWLPSEVLREQFLHPIVTPFWMLFGLAGTITITRRIGAR